MEGCGAVWALVRLFAPFGWMGDPAVWLRAVYAFTQSVDFRLCCWIVRSYNAVPS